MTATTRWLGALGLGFYAAHAGRRALIGHPEHLLWMCHVGALVVATGLLAQAAAVNTVGTQWLVAGVPLWLADLAAGGAFFPTSVLTHVGGLLLGLAGLKRLGVARGAWWRSAVALVALAALSRAVTPAADDVNLAFSLVPTGAGLATVLTVALAALVAAGTIFYAVGRGLTFLGFREATSC